MTYHPEMPKPRKVAETTTRRIVYPQAWANRTVTAALLFGAVVSLLDGQNGPGSVFAAAAAIAALLPVEGSGSDDEE